MKDYLRSVLPCPLKNAYYIGFLKETEMSLPIAERYEKVRWLDVCRYKDEGWFADPFILSVNDNIIELFAEEMIYKTGRGILAYLKVDINSCEILEKHTMLELDTHLSFPIYLRDNGKLYVYPENYQSGSLKIYEYDEQTKSLICPRIIINAPLLDTQILKLNGLYYAFGVQFQTGLQKDTKKLYVYQANTLHGGYKLIQIIENPRCEERGAGLIYTADGRLIRPAQSCEGGYGREVNLQMEVSFIHIINWTIGWLLMDGDTNTHI